MLVTGVRLQRDTHQFAALVSHMDSLPRCQKRNSSTLFMSWVSERMEQLPLTFSKRRRVTGSPFFMKQNEVCLIWSDLISNLMGLLRTGAQVFPHAVRANRLFFPGEGYREVPRRLVSCDIHAIPPKV